MKILKSRRKLVRLHMDGSRPSLEGILTGFWADHYLLTQPEIMAAPGETYALDGPEVRVPKTNVVFVEVLRS